MCRVLTQHGATIELNSVLAFERCIKHVSNVLASYSEPSLREIALPLYTVLCDCVCSNNKNIFIHMHAHHASTLVNTYRLP